MATAKTNSNTTTKKADRFTFTANTVGQAKPKNKAAKNAVSALNKKYGGTSKKK